MSYNNGLMLPCLDDNAASVPTEDTDVTPLLLCTDEDLKRSTKEVVSVDGLTVIKLLKEGLPLRVAEDVGE